MTRRSRIGRLLAQQGEEAGRAFRSVRPGRALWILIGVLITAVGILGIAILPLFVQRGIAADDAATAQVFLAIALALLAQAGLIYVSASLLGYVTAELFAPRRGMHLRGPGAKIWRSLHRLGNATSVTLVVGITGTAIGIALFGEWMQEAGSRDTPGELGAIQLGILLFVLLVALSYDAVRVVVELLDTLPAVWAWAAALVFPWVSAIVWFSVLPIPEVTRDIIVQWGGNPDTVELDAGDGVAGAALLFVATLWAVHFFSSGQPRRIRAAWRATP